MKKRVSVCIPTYNRPQFFEEALESVLEQEPKPFEVLVGDDSTNKKTEQLVRRYQEEGVPIRYFKNEPSLGHPKNVDKLLKEVKGDYMVLLHDDDRLVEGALKTLSKCFDSHNDIIAAFGKQHIIEENGKINWEGSKNLNSHYYRTEKYVGKQANVIRSAVTQQFPNNGYVVKSDIAKEVGYYHKEAGRGGDFAFGVKLAQATNKSFYFANTYTAQYRLSAQSLARGKDITDSNYHAFKMALNMPLKIRRDPEIDKWLHNQAQIAVMTAAQKGFLNDGFRWFFGRYHRPYIFSLGGANRFYNLIKGLLK